jgi:glycosyltransferase involved in cell wall biosynthesis
MTTRQPRISVVTPSFNQARYLERTILSVLDQGYPNLEYIIIDGGSTDGSVEIIRKYEDRLAFWVSEADRGQAHAINKGLLMATGDWVGWQNSDDIYYPGCFSSLVAAASRYAAAGLIIGNMNLLDPDDKLLRDLKYVRPTYHSILAEGMRLTNQAAFWRKEVHQEIGYLDESLSCGFDYDWFLRLLRVRRAAHVNRTWGGLRLHDQTKTANQQEVFDMEYRRILAGREPSSVVRRVFQLRRLVLTACAGNIHYVLRGLRNRTTSYLSRRDG